MQNNKVGDEIAGRIEALAWFIFELTDELEARGCIDSNRLLNRLRLREELDDQLEYVRIAHNHLRKLADAFETGRPAAVRR